MKRCGHCGKPALSSKPCKEHGQNWCMRCGKHDDLLFRDKCGETPNAN